MNATIKAWAVVLIALAALACSSDDDGSSASSSGSTTGSSGTGGPVSEADGSAACHATCDAQAAAKCPKMPPSYVESCRTLCNAAYKKAPAECKGARGAYDVCTRDKATYACNESGTLQTTPQGACAAEVQGCASCSPSAGASCFGLF